MILGGLLLLVLSWVLPDFTLVPPGVEHALTTVGWILVVIGFVVLIFHLVTGRQIGPRRYYY